LQNTSLDLIQLCRTDDLEQSSHWNLFLQLRSNF